MTQARIEMDSGAEVLLGSAYGSCFDLDPLTSVEAELSTLSGFQQIGERVSGAAVGGLDRTLSGTFLDGDARAKARQLCRALVPGAAGRLYLGERLYTAFYVEKSPELDFLSRDCIDFTCMLFCGDPWWYSVEPGSDDTCAWVPAFAFSDGDGKPTFDRHCFATMTDGFASLQNDGNAESSFSLTLTALQDCSGVFIENADTLEHLALDCTLEKGDVVQVSWEDGSLEILKNGTENLFSALTEDSTLLTLAPGGNLIRSGAAEGASRVNARITFHAAWTCALPED